MAKKKIDPILDFPLINEARHIEQSFISEHTGYVIPSYINENLAHTLRYYQDAAIRFFHYSQEKTVNRPNHLMFNMATGSGKTDLMAGLILYLYQERGYQNFLFTVNTNSVLMKTKDNLVNSSSDKYLFSDKIEIDGKIISVKQVERFPRIIDQNTIYIKLSSVQKMSDDLFIQKENTMGVMDYAKHPVVVLADEAHHYSASTKTEKEKENTWESAIQKILNAREDNILLEFTATVEFEKEAIYNKYKDKVVYRYALNRLMADRYSKNVKRIQSQASDRDKMLNAVLVSQFRKYRAEFQGITETFKPIILFKSSKIDVSNKANQDFKELIASLTSDSLLDFIRKNKGADSEILSLAYHYYEKNEDRLDEVISDLKRDFNARNIINANDTERGNMLEKGQYQALNTLESPNNFYRVVFAVAKLTEGWDVLNLYDIVRIEQEAKTNKTATMVEAQLIGRGARYYPFLKDGVRSYQCRFDGETGNDSLILETLHYHTMNEPQYLKQLVASLKEMDLPTGKDEKNPPIEIKLKKSFKQTEVYKNGKIYYNESEEVSADYFVSLDSYGIQHKQDITRNFYSAIQEVSYLDEGVQNETKQIHVAKFDERYIKKAIQKISFYQFDNLRHYLPNIDSMSDFIYGENWLNTRNIKLFVNVPLTFTSDLLSPNDILDLTVGLLKEYETKIKSGFIKQRGTNKFVGYPISNYLTDYKKRIPRVDSNTLTTQIITATEVKEDFFVYETAIMNQLEHQLLERIKSRMGLLREKYGKNVYLFRMDENMHRESAKAEKLKLHQYGNRKRYDGTVADIHVQGFQPDFILFLEDKEVQFQIFIEPKGMSGERFEKELWKEDLLLYMSENHGEIDFVDQVGKVEIHGLKFYTTDDGRGTMEQLEKIVL
ncbi:DEAD/DEAH box helicase family protein [Pseudolactococcus laudensis]|uniref:DEAD/DEAH box helicase family protein n=1 Tax=Pseudolactococcus laudensis TaxID=1494461 RepID=UPI003F9BA29E